MSNDTRRNNFMTRTVVALVIFHDKILYDVTIKKVFSMIVYYFPSFNMYCLLTHGLPALLTHLSFWLFPVGPTVGRPLRA